MIAREKIHFKKDPVTDKDADQPQSKKQAFHKETTYVKRTLNFSRLSNALRKDWTQLTSKQLKYMPKVYFVVRRE